MNVANTNSSLCYNSSDFLIKMRPLSASFSTCLLIFSVTSSALAQSELNNIDFPQSPRELLDNQNYRLEEQIKPSIDLGDFQEVKDSDSLLPVCLLEENINDETLPIIQEVQVIGNTVLHDEIKDIIDAYQSKERQPNLQELFCLTTQITDLYIDNGYITSGAFLPQQSYENQVIIQIVEGRLSENGIQINELDHIHKRYITSRIERVTKAPLNQDKLEEVLQLLQQESDFFRSIEAELAPSLKSGESTLQLQINEQSSPFTSALSISNSRPSNIGEWEASIQARYNNLLGFGDRLTANYGITKGLDTASFNYSLPFNARSGTFNISYSKNDSLIISENFRDLGIRSNSENFSFGINQPISKSPTQNFTLGVALDLRKSQSFILDDIPFSFSIGPENGKSKVAVLRLSQSWSQRNASRIFAANSQLSIGLDAFDATINELTPDGKFIKWLGQFQYLQQLSESGVTLITQIEAQLTPDSLLSLEKFSSGGVQTVRGFPQNYLVGDNGVNFSLELRIPVGTGRKFIIRPFFDAATVWNSSTANSEQEIIASIGLGATWQPVKKITLELDYGIPLTGVQTQENSLQSKGLNFSVLFQPFTF